METYKSFIGDDECCRVVEDDGVGSKFVDHLPLDVAHVRYEKLR